MSDGKRRRVAEMRMVAGGTWREEIEEVTYMEASVGAVENLLRYRFKQRKLLEEALTHSSCADSTSSYQRLEFVGDAVLGLAFSNFAFLEYPGLDPGKLSLVRSANINTKKLARVTVRHRLYKYLCHNVPSLDEKGFDDGSNVRQVYDALLPSLFTEDSCSKCFWVQGEEQLEIHGGLVKAPKVLADIVESVAAALYIDCNFDLHATWKIFRVLLEPVITRDVLSQQPQPVTMLFESCQKEGKYVDISYWRNKEKLVATVTIDGKFIVSASSENKENAKLLAAKTALEKLSRVPCDPLNDSIFKQLNHGGEILEAKQKLHELCGKKKWHNPKYKILKEVGSAHEKRYTCSVAIELSEGILFMEGNEKPRVKEVESSAASRMLFGLKNSHTNYV